MRLAGNLRFYETGKTGDYIGGYFGGYCFGGENFGFYCFAGSMTYLSLGIGVILELSLNELSILTVLSRTKSIAGLSIDDGGSWRWTLTGNLSVIFASFSL